MFHFMPKPRPPTYDGRETIGHAVDSSGDRLRVWVVAIAVDRARQ